MPGWVDIQIIGNEAGVNAMLAKLGYALSPEGLEAFMQAMVEPWLASRARDRFQDEGDDAVGQWAPLLPATQMIRSQAGYGADHPINRRTGDLETYITQSPATTSQLGAGALLVYPGRKATGKLADKVETAQVGNPYANTVARPVLGMDETDLAMVLGSLGKFIQGLP